MKKWVKSANGTNEFLNCDRFYISYFKVGMSEYGLRDIEETALCHGENIDILQGDHRAEYEARSYDLGECIAYYNRKAVESSN